jgi:hypothetical protein
MGPLVVASGPAVDARRVEVRALRGRRAAVSIGWSGMVLEDGRDPGAARRGAGTTAAGDSVAPAWFALLFTLAVMAHIIGNPPTGSVALRVGDAVLGASALALAWRPASRPLWAIVASMVLVTAWLEAPVLGNHWMLAAAFAAAVLVAVVRDRPWSWLATTVRLLFVTFYAFAAFAKLNTAFLDPAVSCAVFYANRVLASWGLPTLPDGGMLAVLTVMTVVAIELSVPVLLVVPRTRALGVALAAAFHYVISLDLAQHFYDFTAVIVVGLATFAHDDVTAPIGAWFRRRRATTAVVLTAVWAVLLALVVLPLGTAMVVLARAGIHVLWIPLGAAVVWLALRGVGRPAAVAMRPAPAAAVVLLALVVVNGLLPYVGVKTAFGWNMYANLVTVDGRANHLIVGPQAEVVAPRYVEVTATTDERLRAYVGSAWAVPERNLRHHLTTHPDATVTFVRSDGTTVSGTGRELGRPMPEVVRRLAPLRSVDRSTPARCQALWLPAL